MAIDYNRRRPAQEPEPEAQPTPGTPGISYAKPAAPVPAGQAAPAAAGAVSLSKITLTKSAPTVSLAKSSTGTIQVNLNWSTGTPQAPRSGGFLKRLTGQQQSGAPDLDLGCLYEFTDGTKGVVQALGGSFDAFSTTEQRPVIRLDGDDRTGANTDGENLFIDLAQTGTIRRILVFAFIYQGAPNWAAANGVVTLTQPSGPPIEVRLDEADPQARFCAIALITNEGPVLNVRREVKYVQGTQRTVDEAYGWGLNWTPGRK